MKRTALLFLFLFSSAGMFSSQAFCAAAAHTPAPVAGISVLWSLPFVGILLCIAVIPLINAHFWEKNLWWISLGVFCVPMAIIFGVFMGELLREKTVEKLLEYISFIILLASLFVISGGILVKGKLNGTPVLNSVFMLVGSIIASFVGTTGASMLLIRPLIRANKNRQKKAHIVIFFIFLVSNIGGVLTPLGDPPLFLGYLQGVPFEWTFRLFPQWLFTSAVVLLVFFIYDNIMYRRENPEEAVEPESADESSSLVESISADIISAIDMLNPGNEAIKRAVSRKLLVSVTGNLASARAALVSLRETAPNRKVDAISSEINSAIDLLNPDQHAAQGTISRRLLENVNERIEAAAQMIHDMKQGAPSRISISLDGKINLAFLAGVVFIVFMQGFLLKKAAWWPHFGPQEVGMLIMLGLSLFFTPAGSELRIENGFTFQPIKEVALIFAGIFATMIPALYILETKGASLGIVKPWQFFWATGGLSSFLDNAPTYLTFVSVGKSLHLPNTLNFIFNDGGTLTTPILSAISCGAVFMGANTYIGNGPNFMVRSIAEEQGVKMPSFFGYMLYSGLVLIPTFILVTFIFFV